MIFFRSAFEVMVFEVMVLVMAVEVGMGKRASYV
jgi:hypothetical protein